MLGEMYMYIQLKLHEYISVLGSDPADVMAVSGPQRALTGQTVTLTCTITAIPAATVMWYKNGIAIIPGGRIRIDITPDTNTQLRINSVTMANNGMYQCFVSNDHGDDVGTISLQVRDHGKSELNGLYSNCMPLILDVLYIITSQAWTRGH